MTNKTLKKIIVTCFVLVPLLSSIISTVHLVDLFYLGNPSWISYTIATAIEIGAVASFLTLSILSRLNKGIVWSVFVILFFMQVVGNVYFSYDWVTKKIEADSNWLKNFTEMMEFFVFELDQKTAKMFLSLLVGVPIPLISVFLLKSTVDYLGNDKEPIVEETPEPIVEETPQEILAEEISSDNHEKNEETPEIHITEESSQEEEEQRKRNRTHPARS